MKNKLTAIFLFLSIVCYGQKEYYLTDSISSYGSELVDNGDFLNSKFCTVKVGDKTVQYSPNEVKEYGFIDGRVYLAKDIQLSDSVQRVFLERLVKGKITLYYYRGKKIKTFFISTDSSLLVELPKRNNINFRDKLKDLTADCPNVADAVKLSTYSKPVLAKLITSYNDCTLKPFPFIKFGVLAGYEALKLIPTTIISDNPVGQLDYKYNGGFTVGLFVDKPINLSDFSFHAELYYSQHGFSYNKLLENNEVDFIANIASLKIPFLIRYTLPFNTLRPFINAGGVFSYNIKNTNSLYETTINQNSIVFNGITSTTLINSSQFGFSIGGGVEYKLNYKNHLFCEIRFTNLYGEVNRLNTSEFNFITGINF